MYRTTRLRAGVVFGPAKERLALFNVTDRDNCPKLFEILAYVTSIQFVHERAGEVDRSIVERRFRDVGLEL